MSTIRGIIRGADGKEKGENFFFFFRFGSNFAFYRGSSFNPLEFLFETVDNKRGRKMDEGGEKFELERQGNIGFLFFNQ